MWKGDWNGEVFAGEYEFLNGTVFQGTATWKTKHVLVHTTQDGYTKTVEHEVEPHFEFTGTWVAKDGTAGPPIMPEPPSRK